jgi:hypothetical protein
MRLWHAWTKSWGYVACGLILASVRLANLIYKFTTSVRASVRLWPLDAEKSDGGRREKWREKDKTTVGWRAFEVLKPRSWEPGPETSLLRASVRPSVTTGRREKWREKDKTTVGWRAFEVLRARSWNLALRAWNPGPEIQVLKPRVEVLKPRSWERACVINWLKQLTGTH